MLCDAIILLQTERFLDSSCIMADSNAGRGRQGPDPAQFPIYTQYDLERFLKEIQSEFIRCVDPVNRLLDKLMESDLATETDLESLNGRHYSYREKQARKVWFHLQSLPVERFNAVVLPELCAHYPHILPKQWVCYDGNATETAYCLRHMIVNRVRPAESADILYQYGCLTLEEYRTMADETQEPNARLSALLTVVCDHHWNSIQAPDVVLQAVQTVLKHYRIPEPENLMDLVSQGIPCTCARGQDLEAWADAEGLPRDVINLLKMNGISTVEELPPFEEMMNFLWDTALLKPTDLLALKAALSKSVETTDGAENCSADTQHRETDQPKEHHPRHTQQMTLTDLSKHAFKSFQSTMRSPLVRDCLVAACEIMEDITSKAK